MPNFDAAATLLPVAPKSPIVAQMKDYCLNQMLIYLVV